MASYDETVVQKNCNDTHMLPKVTLQDIIRLPYTRICSVTHILMVIGQGMMILPFRKMCNDTDFLMAI